MRHVPGILLTSVLTVAALAAPATAGLDVVAATPPAAAESAAPAADVDQVVVPDAAPEDTATAATEDVVAELEPTRTSSFGLVGVTWRRDARLHDVGVDVRTREDGTWGPWQELHVEHDHGTTGETRTGRDGTEPTWVGDAEGVAVRVENADGRTPEDVRVLTIDPGEEPDGTRATTTAATTAAAAAATGIVPKPSVRTRSSWGAAPAKSCDSPVYGAQGRGVTIHHTAGSNSYSKSQSAGIVRAVQAYHQKGRGWCDIGYNVLVDKYGQMFEGRAGGLDRPVRAAHSGNARVNEESMGISLMGTFTSTTPSAAMKDAVVALASWRMSTFYLPATGKVTIGGRSLNRIHGHRDVVGTACPGARAYSWISASGGLRSRVASRIAAHSTPTRTEAERLGATRTGGVTQGEKAGATYGIVRMQKVDLYHHASYGTFYVDSLVRTEYRRTGSSAGPLRYPTSNRANTAVAGVSKQDFQQGRIWRVTASRNAAYALHGDISARYDELGGPAGALGEPRSSVVTSSTGSSRATFQNGRIDRTRSGIVVVSYS